MKVSRVEILNFRSIRNQSVIFEEISEKSCLILLGRNESGKSNILKAIALLNEGNQSRLNYANDCNKAAETLGEKIEINFYLNLENFYWYKDRFVKDGLPMKLVEAIDPASICRCVDVAKDNSVSNYIYIDLKENDIFSKFAIKDDQIKAVSEIYSGTDKVTEENASTLLGEGWDILDHILLEGFLEDKYYKLIDERIPQVIYWEYDEKYLINQTIDLNNFKLDTQTCIPLRNIFNIASINDIEKRLDLIATNKEKRKQLEEELSSSITVYINSVWKEHAVNIKVDIESMQCSIMIEDKDNTAPKYSMDQRSDGFKQFISILLNISAENSIAKLKDKIILLDEPEVHLHPSGVRFLRDELLNISKNNTVVVASHSVFMIDKKNLDRHYAVQKDGAVTTVEKISNDNPYQDEVVYEALGTSVYELIQENMIVFEGKTDRDLFNAFTQKFKTELKPVNFGVISADGVEKIQNYTKFFNQKLVRGFVVVDSDGPGQAAKKKVLSEAGFSAKNVFELTELVAGLPGGSTLEDLFPIDVVAGCVNNKWKIVLSIEPGKPVIKQIEKLNGELKGKLNPDDVKEALIGVILADIKGMTKAQCKEKYPLCFAFVEKLHQNLKA